MQSSGSSSLGWNGGRNTPARSVRNSAMLLLLRPNASGILLHAPNFSCVLITLVKSDAKEFAQLCDFTLRLLAAIPLHAHYRARAKRPPGARRGATNRS